MIGNRVRVVRESADNIEGVLLKCDDTGVIVHKCYGFDDERVFVPMVRITEIIDLGRAP